MLGFRASLFGEFRNWHVTVLVLLTLLASGVSYVSGGRWSFVATFSLGAGVYAAVLLWIAFAVRADDERLYSAWNAVAQPLGFRAERLAKGVAIVGTVGTLRFELDRDNFLTYGVEQELGMRVRLADEDCRLELSFRPRPAAPSFHDAQRWRDGFGEVLDPTGDAEFDAAFLVCANRRGRELVARLAAETRRTLLDFHFEVYQHTGSILVRFPRYEPEPASILAAQRLLSDWIAAVEALPVAGVRHGEPGSAPPS